MPLRKLSDDNIWEGKQCRSPEHNPPNMMVFEPGRYEWTCPDCGHKTYFTVPKPDFKYYGRGKDACYSQSRN